MKTPRQPLPMTASEYLTETVYPTLEPALEAMLKAAFPADEKAAEGEEELPVLDTPLLWLAKYLKERNSANTTSRKATTWEQALILAQDPGQECKSYHDVYNRGLAATRSVFWPCSAVIAVKEEVVEQVPATPRVVDEAERDKADEPAEAGEGEEGEKPVPMKDVHVPVLRYVATSHPDARAIEGWLLRYQEQGRTGEVIAHGKPLLIKAATAVDEGLHFFCGRVPGAPGGGSYCAVPLKETDGTVYGVLAMDTILDARQITEQDVAKLSEIATRIDSAREPFAAVDREKKRIKEEEEAAAAAAAEEERKRAEEAAAGEREGEGGDEGGDKGN